MNESEIRSTILDLFPTFTVRIEHAPGGTPGLPDILYFPREHLAPCAVGLELKSPKRKLSAAQKGISKQFTRNGVPYMFLRFDRGTDLFTLSLLQSKDSYRDFRWITLPFESLVDLHEHIMTLLEGWP